MLTILAILLVFLSLAMFLGPLFIQKETVEGNAWGGGKEASPQWMIDTFNWRKGVITLSVAAVLILIPFLFFWSEQGYQYILVYPNGAKKAVMTEGIKFRGFAKIWEWQKFIDVKVPKEGEDTGEIEGVMTPIPIRFIDQVTAKGHVSVRFQLPSDEESFIALGSKFRTMENLTQNTLVPTVSEQFSNSGYMFAAQDYISGEAQSFRQTFEEILKGGTYVVNKTESTDTLYDNFQEEDRRIREIRTTYSVEKVLENGIPKRIPHEITENKIIVSQVIVDDIDLEPTFRERLQAQRDESAKRQLEQQKIETAKASQQRILAEGERDKAAERVTQEKEQVKQLIAIETKLKQENTNKELAAIKFQTAELEAKAVKVTAEAESYKNAKLVQAGLTPQEKADIWMRTQIGIAEKIAGPQGLKMPNFYMSGNTGNSKDSNDALTQIMTMMLAGQTMSQMNNVGK